MSMFLRIQYSLTIPFMPSENSLQIPLKEP